MSDEIINKSKFNFSEFFNKNKKKLVLIVITAILIVFTLIIFNEFTIENRMLTPTLKLKRKIILENYKKDLENLYLNN